MWIFMLRGVYLNPGNSLIKIYWFNFEQIRFFFLYITLSYENSATYGHLGVLYQNLSVFTKMCVLAKIGSYGCHVLTLI